MLTLLFLVSLCFGFYGNIPCILTSLTAVLKILYVIQSFIWVWSKVSFHFPSLFFTSAPVVFSTSPRHFPSPFPFLVLLLIGLVLGPLPPNENPPFLLICSFSFYSICCPLEVLWDVFNDAFAFKGIWGFVWRRVGKRKKGQ